MTLSIKGLNVAISITDTQRYNALHNAEYLYAECLYAECHYGECLLNVIMPSVFMLNVIMP